MNKVARRKIALIASALLLALAAACAMLSANTPSTAQPSHSSSGSTSTQGAGTGATSWSNLSIAGMTLEEVVAALEGIGIPAKNIVVHEEPVIGVSFNANSGNGNSHTWLTTNEKIQPPESSNGHITIDAGDLDGTTIFVHRYGKSKDTDITCTYEIFTIFYTKAEAVDSVLAYYANNPDIESDTYFATGKKGDEVNVLENRYETGDYEFIGWNTSPDGTGDEYAPGDAYALANVANSLYAQWKKIERVSLSLTKEVAMPDGSPVTEEEELAQADFSFHIESTSDEASTLPDGKYPITVEDADGNVLDAPSAIEVTGGVTAPFTLRNGETMSISDLLKGCELTVVEEASPLYNTSYRVHRASTEVEEDGKRNGANLPLVAEGGLSITCTNTLREIEKSASFSKRVTGVDADKLRDFDFTVEVFEDAECTVPYDGELHVNAVRYDNLVISSGDAVQAHHNDEIRISAYILPSQTLFMRVTESEDENYGLQGLNGRILELDEEGASTTEFVNDVYRGSLQMTKKVDSLDPNFAYDGRSFDFSISLYHDPELTRPLAAEYTFEVVRTDGTTLSGKVAHGECVPIAAGDVVNILDLPAGSYYIANETNCPGFMPDDAKGAATGEVRPGYTIDMPFTNTYMLSTLTVSKKVVSPAIAHRSFLFTLHFYKDGKPYEGNVKSSWGRAFSNAEQFSLRPDEFVVLDIPEGVEWLVEESDYANVTQSVTYARYSSDGALIDESVDDVSDRGRYSSDEAPAGEAGPAQVVFTSGYTAPVSLPLTGSELLISLLLAGCGFCFISAGVFSGNELEPKRD